MRKFLLKLANKIYDKYSFQEIRENQLFVFKGDIYRVVSCNLIQEPQSCDELKVVVHEYQSLGRYLLDKLSKK